MMSGSSLLIKPLPSFVHEHTYEATLKALGLKELSTSERIQAILTIPYERVLGLLPPSLSFMPLIDDDILPAAMTFEQMSGSTQNLQTVLPGIDWCDSLLIGDMQFDVSTNRGF